MTMHEILAALVACEDAHKKLHGGPLTIGCFVEGLRINERRFGYSPKVLSSHFHARVPKLKTKGWIEVREKCGQQFLKVTRSGVKQLAAWNEHGCKSHEVHGRSARSFKRKCIGNHKFDPGWAPAA
jgi:hypothetical protein